MSSLIAQRFDRSASERPNVAFYPPRNFRNRFFPRDGVFFRFYYKRRRSNVKRAALPPSVAFQFRAPFIPFLTILTTFSPKASNL
jgi:hypothetical protein